MSAEAASEGTGTSPEAAAQKAEEKTDQKTERILVAGERTRFDSESARTAAKRSWEVRRERAARAAEAVANGDAPGVGNAMPTRMEERDRALALRELRTIVGDSKTPAAVKVQAAKVLAGVEDVVTAARPPSIEALEELSTAELEALVLAHL